MDFLAGLFFVDVLFVSFVVVFLLTVFFAVGFFSAAFLVAVFLTTVFFADVFLVVFFLVVVLFLVGFFFSSELACVNRSFICCIPSDHHFLILSTIVCKCLRRSAGIFSRLLETNAITGANNMLGIRPKSFTEEVRLVINAFLSSSLIILLFAFLRLLAATFLRVADVTFLSSVVFAAVTLDVVGLRLVDLRVVVIIIM